MHNRKVKKVMWDLLSVLNYISLIDGEQAGKTVSTVTIIAGGFLGALAVIMLMLLTAVGIIIFIKKGIQNYFQSNNRSSTVFKCVLVSLYSYLYRFTVDTIQTQKELSVS